MNFVLAGRTIGAVLGRSQGAAAFTPLSIAGCQFWFDASQITGLSDGDSVTTWSDLSGNVRHATQSGAATMKPTYKANIIGGKPVLRFDGGDFLALTSYTIPASLSIFAVIRRASAGTNFLSFANLSGTRYAPWWYSDNVIYSAYWANFNTHGTANTSTGNFIIAGIKSGTTSNVVRRNGAQVGTTQTPQASVGAFDTIGRLNTIYNVTDIAELIFYDSALSAADYGAVEAYLSAKYGISLA